MIVVSRHKLFVIISLILFAAFVEATAYGVMYYRTYISTGEKGNGNLYNHNYFRIRNRLLNDDNPQSFQRLLPTPGLNYIPTPGYVKEGEVQHNFQGFRGPPVNLKDSRTLKILFLGGSTTYGFGVAFYKDSYPARCGRLLNENYRNDSTFLQYFDSVVVINAGVDAATSQEELSGYLYKWKYFNPDIIVIHSGGNDAQAMSLGTPYQPDYTNFRNIHFYIKPLPQPYRTFFYSYFLSFVAIHFFYNDLLYQSAVYADNSTHVYSKWFNQGIRVQVAQKDFRYYAFYQNMNALLAAIENDGKKALVLPFVLNMQSPIAGSDSLYTGYNQVNNFIIDSLSKKYKIPLVPYTYNTIKKAESWLDDCHLNPDGEQDKAALVAASLTPVINGVIIARKDNKGNFRAQ